MKMENPEEEIIFNDDRYKHGYYIDEEEFYCAGVRRPSIESSHVEILEPQNDNDKSYLQLIQERK